MYVQCIGWAIKMHQQVKVQAAKVCLKKTNKNQDSISLSLPVHGGMSFSIVSQFSAEPKLPGLRGYCNLSDCTASWVWYPESLGPS